MGKPSSDQIAQWLSAAGKSDKVSKPVQERIIAAACFVERTARYSKSGEVLSGIDFSKPVEVVKLKAGTKVYVQYVAKHKGRWFTDTGLSPDAVGIAEGAGAVKRTRKLFVPRGEVPALKCVAKSIKDTWTVGRIFSTISPSDPKFKALLQKRFPEKSPEELEALRQKAVKRLGQETRGGGTQYFVSDPLAMQEL